MEWERQRTYDFENGKEAGIEIGKETGKEAQLIESVLGLHENKVSIEVIAKSLKLSEEKVKEIISHKVPVNAQFNREIINMLCAKYSYKDDIAVKQEEAREEGKQQKAMENARKLLADGKYTAEEISELFNIPVEAFTDKVKA